MCHANTTFHNKEVILNSMQKADGVVWVVFAAVALGMSVNLVGVNRVFHYGALASIDDYFQESERAGRSREAAKSTVYWKPSDALLQKNTSDSRNMELIAVCHYLENNTKCRDVGGNFWTNLILCRECRIVFRGWSPRNSIILHQGYSNTCTLENYSTVDFYRE